MSPLVIYFFYLSSSLTSLAICLLMWYYWTYRKMIAVALRLPTMNQPLSLLSPFYFVLLGVKGFTNIAERKLKEIVSSGIDTVVFWIGPVPHFFISKPEDIQIVMNNCLAVGPEANVLEYFIGSALLIAPVHIWRVTRRYYQPLYHPRNLNLLMSALNQCGRDLAVRLSRHVGSVSVDLMEDLGSSSFKAACCLIFGPDFKTNLESSSSLKLVKSISRINDLIVLRLLKFWLRPDFLFRMVCNKELKDIETTFEELLSSSIKVDSEGRPGESDVEDSSEDKSRGEEEENIGENRDYLPFTRLQDAFETLRNAHPEFTPKALKGEILSTLIAGTETTQLTTSFCLLALAAHPDIQEAVYEEISVTKRDNEDVTMEDLKAMTYLDQVVKETLRKFLIVPFITRKVERDVKLSFGTLPVGATVVIVIPAVHYNPQIYPDPERFDPDRFTSENVAKRHKCSFIPFLTGPRNCIGQQFAMLEAKMTLVHLIRRFKFTTSVNINNVEYEPGLTYRPANLNPLKVQYRH